MGWYNSSWGNRVEITVDATHVDSDLTDFCCLIDERDLPASFWTTVDSDGDDIVVTSSDGTTKLSRDLTEWDSTANTMTMRVKIPTLSSSSNTVLYLYYGNSGATETNDTAAYRSEIECHYPLGSNDNAGGSLECDDRTDNNVDLLSSGTMTDVDVVDGQVGKSVDFDGSDDHLYIADAENLSFGNGSSDVAFSVSFWMRADVTTAGSIVAKSHVYNGGEWYVHWANSKIYFRCVDHSSSGYIGRVPTTTLTTATWHKVTCTYDGNSSSGLKVYYNGVSKSLDTSSQTPYTAMENTAYDFKIGARDTSVRFNGKVDEVFVYREELSAAHIKASYRNDNTSSYTFYTVGAESAGPVLVIMPDASAVGTSKSNNVIEGSDWYHADWVYRAKVTVDYSEVDSNLTDYLMLLDERSLPATFWDNTRTDGFDVLITEGDGVTALDKDTSEWSDNDETFVARIKVPYLSATSNTCLYIYYGKAAASVDLSTEDAYTSDVVSHFALNGDPTDSEPQQIDRITSNGVDLTCWSMETEDVIDGPVGKGLNFNTSEFLFGADTDAWSFGDGSDDTPFSVSIWFNTDLVTAVSRYFINKTTDKTHGEWYLQHYEDDLYFRCVDDSTSGYIGRVALAAVSVNTWHKLDFTYDGSGSDSGFKIYRDGEELSTSTSSNGTYVAMENTDDLPRMAAGGAGAFPYDGQLDDAFVRNSVLAAEHIKAAYLNEKTSSTFYAVGSEESNIVNVIVTTTPVSAIGSTVAPTIVLGSLTVTPTEADAIGSTVDPTIVLGSLTVTTTEADAIGSTVSPTVIGEGVLIVAATVSAIGDADNINIVEGSDWYNASWYRRIKITISDTDVDDNLIDFPMLIDERDLPATFWDEVDSDGADIRVTTGDGTILSHDLGEWVPSSNTLVLRANVPYISGSDDSTVYLYYNNPGISGSNSSAAYGSDAISHYDFDKDPSSATQGDRAGSTLMTPVGFSTDERAYGEVGLGFTFTEADSQYLEADDTDDWTFGNGSTDSPFSVSVWAKSTLTDVQSLVSKNFNSVSGEWSVLLYNDRVYFRCFDESENGRLGVYTPQILTANTWNKYDLVYDGSSTVAGFSVYLDGVKQSTFSGGSGSYTAMENTGNTPRIGTDNDDSNFFDGEISDLTLYGAALTPVIIKATHSNEKSASTFYAVGGIETNGILVREEATAIGDTLDPTTLTGSVTITATISAIGDTIDPSVLHGSLSLTTTDADAIGDTLDPTVLFTGGGVTVIGTTVSAIGDTVAPTVLYGSLSLTTTGADAIGGTIDPTVLFTGGGVIVSGVLAEAIGDTLAPDVLRGSLTASGTATAVGSVLGPTVAYGSLTLVAVVSTVGDTLGPAVFTGGILIVGAISSAIGDTLDPTVVQGDLTVSATVSAIGDTVDPSVIQSSLSLTTTEADAIGDTVDPTILAGGLTFTLVATAIGDTVNPTIIQSSVTVASTASAIGDTIDPSVLMDSLSILSAPVDAIGTTADPIVVYGSLSFTMAADAIGDTVDPTTLVEGSAVIIGLTVSAKGDTLDPTYDVVSMGLDMDNVARWIFSSVAAHFEPIASELDLLYHVEGIDERGDGVSRNDSVELRLTGPNIKEVNGKYLLSTEINVLLTNYMKMVEDTYSLVDWTGKFQAEMLERIPIYKLGTGAYDDGAYLGCLVPDAKSGVKAYYLGQISNVDRIRQSEVDGVYRMEVTF